MKQKTGKLQITVYSTEICKDECVAQSIDEIVRHYRAEIEAHPCARFIGVFDHFAHTSSLQDGEIAPEILDAKNLVFCFGMAIPEPGSLATRPRSIGICELEDRFFITFLEPPMPLVNAAMEAWTNRLVRDASVDPDTACNDHDEAAHA